MADAKQDAAKKPDAKQDAAKAPDTRSLAQKRRDDGVKLWSEAKDCIFVDAAGKEFKAKISPLPTNKGEIINIPIVSNAEDRMREILMKTAPEKQMDAFKTLQEEMANGAPALLIRGKADRLVKYKGMLCKGLQVGATWFPCVDVLVNYSDEDDVENWIPRHSIRFQEHTPMNQSELNGKNAPYVKLAS